MKTLAVLIALVVISAATVVPRVGPVVSHVPRTYNVSLEDSPQTRWAAIIHDYKEPLARFMEYFDMLHIPDSVFKEIDTLSKLYHYQDFVNEVHAVANLSGYPFNKLFFLNFMYEFSTIKACTGILIRNSEGKVMHGRNLDFEMWEILAKLVVNVQYHKKGERIFSVDTVVGSVFALTGIRHGAFAINVDTRKQTNIYEDIIAIMKDNAMPTCWLLRKTLEEQTSYASALARLKTEKIGGPVYYVVSGVGPNEGCVIERDTLSVHAFYELS